MALRRRWKAPASRQPLPIAASLSTKARPLTNSHAASTPTRA